MAILLVLHHCTLVGLLANIFGFIPCVNQRLVGGCEGFGVCLLPFLDLLFYLDLNINCLLCACHSRLSFEFGFQTANLGVENVLI